MKAFHVRVLLPLLAITAVAPVPANPSGVTMVATNAPAGSIVVSPTITFSADGKEMTINQVYDRMVLNWDSFSIAADEVMRFAQPSSASAVLNRVTGGNPSELLGRLEANGSVFLINPNGVLVGASGVINTTGAFVASTRDVTDSAFIAGDDLNFLGTSSAGVENLGFIKSDTGDVVLVGRTVKNSGTIETPQGAAGLAAGDDVLLSSTGNDRLSVRLPATLVATGLTGVDNSGTVKAAQAQLTAAGGNVYSLAVSNGGLVEATGVTQRPDGRIVLTSDGGDIEVGATGQLVAQNASGDGGTILVGGGSLGNDADVPSARNTTVKSGALIQANATSAMGDGGWISYWSENITDVSTPSQALAGASGGNGGTIEVASRGTLARLPAGSVTASAGQDGLLRFAASELQLTNESLISLLQSGNVELTTRVSASTGTGDIVITGGVIAAGTRAILRPHGLSLLASRDINLNGPLSIYTQLIPSNTSMTQGAGLGDFTFDATRDINLNALLNLSAASTGGGFTTLNPSNTDGPNLTVGTMRFTAGGNFTSTAGFGFSASSTGGHGEDNTGSTPSSVLRSGGSGGDITVGALEVTAAGDVAISSLSYSARSNGGRGGRADGGGTGGEGGQSTLGGLSVNAGGTLLLQGTTLIQANSTGGGGGESVGNSAPTFRDGGIGGTAGDAAIGTVAFNATDLDLRDTLTFTLTSRGGQGSKVSTGGAQSPSVVGIGGAAGNVSGSIGFAATRDILSLGGTTQITASAFTQNGDKFTIGDGLGGAGGSAGTATLAATTYTAGRNLSSAATTSSLRSNANLSLIAGDSATLTNARITTTGILTIVADNVAPTEPDYGSGALTLSNTELVSSSAFTADATYTTGAFSGGDNSTVRLFGVDTSLVTLGTFVPAATGTQNQYYGDADTLAGGLYYKAIIKSDPLTITANDVNLTYGFNAFPAFTASYAGFVAGDDAGDVTGLLFSTTAALGANVGSYTITPFGATAPANYAISYVDGTLTVSPATLNVRAGDFSKVYGAVMPALTGTATGLVNGDAQSGVVSFAPTTTATAGSNVGTYAITPNATLLSSNYVLGTETAGTLTITRAPLLISADNLSRAFGSDNPTLTATYSGLVNGDAPAVVSGLSLSTTATPASGAGSYPITNDSTATAANYAITFAPGTLTVGNPDFLTITADDLNLTYGFTAFPGFTASYAGFVSGDTASDVTGLQFFTNATLGANAGSYTITPFGAAAPSNYVIAYVNGTLTVNPAVLNVAANNVAKTYGAALPALTGAATGLVNGDALASVVSFAPTTTATAGSNIGTYAIDPNATLLSANYVLGTQTAGTLTIGTALLAVAANHASTTYGAAIPTLTGAATGLVNGDTQAAVVSFAPTTTATLGSNAGTYIIQPNATLLGATPNYAIGTITDGVLTINPAHLTVTAADATRIYGAENPAFSASATGFVNGDALANVVSFAPTITATAGSNVGTYFISPTPTLLSGNYTIGATNPGLLTITPARLDLQGTTFTMVYGSDGTPGVTATGLANGDTLEEVVSVRYGYEQWDGSFGRYAFADANVEQYDYAINDYRPWVYEYPVLAGLLSSNYTLGTVTPGTFTVTPRSVTISLQGYDLSRAVSGYENVAFRNADGQANGNQLTAYAGDPNLTNPELTGQSVHRDRFVFTFDGIKPSDLARSTAQGYSVSPQLAYQADRQLADGSVVSGPVITGVYLAPSWTAASNYTFTWVQPTAADLNYLPSTPVSVTVIDIATIVGNPRLNPIYAFTGPGLGELNGMDLTQNRFGYVTNWTTTAQSGIYWYGPTLPASVDPGGIAYPSTTTNAPDRITLADVYWWSPLLDGTDLQVTTLNPGLVKVYNTSGDLNAANNNAQGRYWALRAAEESAEDETTDTQTTGGGRIITVTKTTTLLTEGYGNPRFNLSSGSIMGYPAYQAQEVYEVVALFLQRSGRASDHASVTNWILRNDNEGGRQAIFGLMTEYILNLSATTISPQLAAVQSRTNIFNHNLGISAPVRTPGQQALMDTIAGAVRSNRIAAYQQVEAEYKAWQDDVRRAKEGRKPTLYSLIDLGEAPPDSLTRKLGQARTGLSQAELGATGALIGSSIAYASTAASLTGMALSGMAADGVVGALMPFATSSATSMAASGPAIAATFVAVVAADAAVKVMKIEKFKDDLEELRDDAYAHASVEGTLGKGMIGQAEILNALRELNGW